MNELSQLELYALLLSQGKNEQEAIDTIIDFFTNGISASWENDKWEQARGVVKKNLKIA